MNRVYIALGSNLGVREELLQQAVGQLNENGVKVLRASSVYETEPMYRADQPAFLNAVVEAETELFPIQLMKRLLRIEAELGRRRGAPNMARTIDLDLLLYERVAMQNPALTLPHPKIEERRFVLQPLAELVPGFVHPVSHKPVAELLRKVAEQKVKRVPFVLEVQGPRRN